MENLRKHADVLHIQLVGLGIKLNYVIQMNKDKLHPIDYKGKGITLTNESSGSFAGFIKMYKTHIS